MCSTEEDNAAQLRIFSSSTAAVTWCDLSPQFFCIDATLLCEFESDKI